MVQLGEIFCYGTQTYHLVLLIFEGFNKNCSLIKKKKKEKALFKNIQVPILPLHQAPNTGLPSKTRVIIHLHLLGRAWLLPVVWE